MFLPRENAPALFAFRSCGARSDARASLPRLDPLLLFHPASPADSSGSSQFVSRSLGGDGEADQILGKAAIFTRHSLAPSIVLLRAVTHTRSRYIRCASSGNEPTDIARRSHTGPAAALVRTFRTLAFIQGSDSATRSPVQNGATLYRRGWTRSWNVAPSRCHLRN